MLCKKKLKSKQKALNDKLRLIINEDLQVEANFVLKVHYLRLVEQL